MVKEQLFAKKYARELLSIADGDLQAARILANNNVGRVENVFLLAQQALEKSLKSVICWLEMPVPFIHDIGALVATIRPYAEPPFGYDLNSLSEYATIRRYLEGHDTFTKEELNVILEKVAEACAWCRSQVL
jgi:HEPN domain-containing protein